MKNKNLTPFDKEQALQIYHTYLTTQSTRGDGVARLPIGSKGLKSLESIAAQKGFQHKAGPSTLEKSLKNGQRVLFWSDQHFFHNNIIQYANRPDTDYTDMNERLAQNYFSTVKDDDVVVWLGDCAFGNWETAKNYFVGKNFPGYKILILGNHDLNKKDATYRDMKIFQEVMLCDGFELEVDNQVRPVIFSHYPIEKTMLPDNGLNFHGHIHDYNIGLPHVNVSVEVIGYRPQTLEHCFELAKNCVPGAFGNPVVNAVSNETLLSESFLRNSL